MKLPSTRMRSLYTRNGAAGGLTGVLLSSLLALFFLFYALPALHSPAEAANVSAAHVGAAPLIEDEDAIALLGLNLGGYDMALAAWSNMNLSEKQALRDQASRIARMAQGAELDGLSSSSEVSRTLRWAISSFLADAWEKKIASETDISDNAARAFFEANWQRYAEPETVRFRKVVYPLSRKSAAQRAKNDLKKAPLSRLKNCVTVDWTEYGSIAEPLSGALRDAPAGAVMGPLETREGYVLYEVIERSGETRLQFEKYQTQVKEDMVLAAIIERLEKLTSEVIK